MYADISQPPPPLPEPRLQTIGAGLRLLPPLSRLGHGPGMLLLVADSETDTPLTIDNGVPGSLIKWAEEGFTVVEIKASALSKGSNVIHTAIEALKQCAECDYDAKVGVVGE